MSSDDKNGVPGRVDAALSFLGHCRWVETDDTAKRALTDLEARVRDNALEVLRLYFAGEMDFGDAPARRRGDDDGATATVREPV